MTRTGLPRATGHFHARDAGPVADKARVGRNVGDVVVGPRLVEVDDARSSDEADVLEEAFRVAVQGARRWDLGVQRM